MQASVHCGLLFVVVPNAICHLNGQVVCTHPCFFGLAVVRLDFFPGVIYPRRFSHAEVHGTSRVASPAEGIQVRGISRPAATHLNWDLPAATVAIRLGWHSKPYVGTYLRNTLHKASAWLSSIRRLWYAWNRGKAQLCQLVV